MLLMCKIRTFKKVAQEPLFWGATPAPSSLEEVDIVCVSERGRDQEGGNERREDYILSILSTILSTFEPLLRGPKAGADISHSGTSLSN